jgi:hypothetical protein
LEEPTDWLLKSQHTAIKNTCAIVPLLVLGFVICEKTIMLVLLLI